MLMYMCTSLLAVRGRAVVLLRKLTNGMHLATSSARAFSIKYNHITVTSYKLTVRLYRPYLKAAMFDRLSVSAVAPASLALLHPLVDVKV